MEEKAIHRITELTIKHVNGTLTVAEQLELDTWLDSNPVNRVRFEERTNVDNSLAMLKAIQEGERLSSLPGQVLDFMQGDLSYTQSGAGQLWRRAVACAAVLLLVAGGIIFYKHSRHDTSVSTFINKPTNIPPGGNRAVLQLADGSRLDLGSALKGNLCKQGNTSLIKLDSGSLLYESQNNAVANPAYNTVFTPRGGTYRVVLPDHTIVWLNSGSSMRFPTSFAKKRVVEVTGEVFFDAAGNKSLPFQVKVRNLTIQVMGTRFNINAYADEKLVRATLVNGTIAVRAGESSKILKPGEQATVEQAIGIIKVDVHAATAWKDGYFLFNGADIQTVMRQIGRWYNVDVIFEGKFTNTAVSALVSRKKNADEVLKILEGSGYSFLISEDLNKITVLHRREIKL